MNDPHVEITWQALHPVDLKVAVSEVYFIVQNRIVPESEEWSSQ